MQLQTDLLFAVLTVCLLQGTSRADKSPESSNVNQVVDNNVISMTVLSLCPMSTLGTETLLSSYVTD